jgi:hypothetical protein
MGLDMYLHAKRYFFDGDETASKVAELFPEIGDKQVKAITVDVGYWRKANAIHKWFVDNVQYGEDDCGEYEVDTTQLRELLELVIQVLEDRTKASVLLPVQAGFFFGRTDYDDWYFQDLEYTKDLLEKVLADEGLRGNWYYVYTSSW